MDESSASLNMTNANGNLAEISFGYMPSNTVYLWNSRIQYLNNLVWKTDIRHKYLAIQYQINKEVRVTSDCLDKYFIISNHNTGVYTIVLPLKASPRCYLVPQRRGQFPQRVLNFGMIDGPCLADSSALCLRFHDQHTLTLCADFLINALKLDCHYGLINRVEMPSQISPFNIVLPDFWSNYAYQMLLSLGYRIKRQITRITIQKIMHLSLLSRNKKYSEHPCYLKLVAIYYRARHNRFFNINQEFDSIQPIPSSIPLSKWEYVPRIYLTPYGVYPLPIKPMRGNRILRERQLFGPSENFCRVIIRDVDLGQPQNDFMQTNEQWVKNLVVGVQHIPVGNQSFYFLLCSNSQLRDRSFWFHTPYNGCGADQIRRWMGDFSRETCVGTRIARMALSLTGTTPTIKVNKIHTFYFGICKGLYLFTLASTPPDAAYW